MKEEPRRLVLGFRSKICALLASSLLLTGCGSRRADLYDAIHEGNATKAAVAAVTPEEATEALSMAAGTGNLSAVQTLVAKGGDINGGYKDKEDPSRATLVSNGNCAPFFGMNDIDGQMAWYFQRAVPRPGWPYGIPLVDAAFWGRLDVVDWLVNHGADVNLQTKAMIASDIEQRNGENVFKLAVVNMGNNAVSAAVLGGRTAVARFLVQHGADLSRYVVFQPAIVPGVVAWDSTKRGMEPVVSPPRSSLYMTHDGFVHTTLPVLLQEGAFVREILARSVLPDIRALSDTKKEGDPAVWTTVNSPTALTKIAIRRPNMEILVLLEDPTSNVVCGR